MNDPEQVSVNVADLRTVVDAWRAHGEPWWPQGTMHRFAAVAYPEWESTDDMRDKARRAFSNNGYPAGVEVLPNEVLDGYLREMHREGLIP